jgi:hypothetical protein
MLIEKNNQKSSVQMTVSANQKQKLLAIFRNDFLAEYRKFLMSQGFNSKDAKFVVSSLDEKLNIIFWTMRPIINQYFLLVEESEALANGHYLLNERSTLEHVRKAVVAEYMHAARGMNFFVSTQGER